MSKRSTRGYDFVATRILLWLIGGAVLGVVSGCAMFSGGLPTQAIEMTVRVGHSVPSGLSVKRGGLRRAELSWYAPEESVYRYRVERGESAGGPFVWVTDVPGGWTAFTDGVAPMAPLADETSYFYRICAILSRKGVMSEFTEAAGTTTAPPPLPPTELKGEGSGSREVTLSWRAPPSPEIVGYRVERSGPGEAEEFEEVGRSATRSYVDGGTPAATLRDSLKYKYRVVAVNAVDSMSEPSGSVVVETSPPPSVPKGLKGTSREVRCAPLSWQPNPEEDVVRYDVYQGRSADGEFVKIGSVQGRTNTSFTDGQGNPGNLEDDGTYYYRIRAINRVTAESGESEVVAVTTRPVPPSVDNFKAVSARPREVPLSWDASADTTVSGYEVWRARGGDEESWEMIVKLSGRNTTSYLDRGGQKSANVLGLLEDGTEYLYKIIGYNIANVRSSGTEPVKARTKVIPVPPSGIKTSRDLARVVRIEWQPNPEEDVHAYVVEASRREDGGFKRLAQVQRGAPGVVLVAEESGLDPAEQRFYRIKALDREGIESLWSVVAEGRSKPVPDAPSGLGARYDNFQTRVEWSAPPQSDVVQYKVWAKRLLSWELLTATDQRVYILTAEEAAKPPTIAVSAVDRDQLESERSVAVKPEAQEL